MFRELLIPIMLSQVRFNLKMKLAKRHKILFIVLRLERNILVIFLAGSLLHDIIKR